MKCLILAAGYATRLYPLTENFPKPLLKVQDKAILDWLIEDIEKSITTSIESKSEDPLIGLGVLFELMWNHSTNKTKDTIY